MMTRAVYFPEKGRGTLSYLLGLTLMTSRPSGTTKPEWRLQSAMLLTAVMPDLEWTGINCL